MATVAEQPLADLLSVSRASKAGAGEKITAVDCWDGLGWPAPCSGDQSAQFGRDLCRGRC
jgi:hypothetical protein